MRDNEKRLVRELVVIRHGVAALREDWDPSLDDERPLTEEGKKKTTDAFTGLLKLVDAPDMVITSPLVRAVQTADILVGVLGQRRGNFLVSETLVPEADPFQALALVASLPKKRVYLVGHSPHLNRLVQVAVGAGGESGGVLIKKAGAALLRTVGAAEWELHWLVTAKMLRLLGGGPSLK